MAKNVSVKYENPVVQYQDNLLLTTIGDVWAYYQLKTFQINVANAQGKSNFKETFVDVFERLQKYDDVDLKLIPVDMDLAGCISQSTVDEIPSVLTLVKEMLVQVRSISQDMELDTALTNAIKQVCNQRLAGEQVGTMAIIEILKAGNEKSQQLANYYESVIPDSMLKLAFSNGQTDSIEFNNQRTILEVTGLDLPHAEQEVRSYTETQKYSVSIMLALGKYLEKFGREDTKRFSAEIIDEAWIFNASPAGRKVLDGIKRLGRSENNMLIYSTQRVGDVNDEKSNGQYGQIFAFDSADDSERENILRHFGLPVNRSNMEW